MQTSKTKKLVTGGLMVAVAFILSMITLFQLPQGGDITAFSMVPIILMSYRYGCKWGMFTGLAFAVLKMITGFQNVMYCPTLLSQIACILLDYIIPYTMLGSAQFFCFTHLKPALRYSLSAAIVCCIRFLCSFLSGIFLWGAYAPAGTPVWMYSLTYNGSYMLPETLITILGIFLLYKTAPQLFKHE